MDEIQNEDDVFATSPFEDAEQKKTSRKEKIFSFVVPICIGIAITVAVLLIFYPASSRSFAHHLCNGLFVSSVILACFGGLTMVNKAGFFDVVFFGFNQLGQVLKDAVTMKKDTKIDTDFIGYKKKKYKKRVARTSWVIVGLVYFLAAIIVVFFV